MDVNDLKRRIGEILLGFDFDNKPFKVKNLGIEGAITVLLKDAIHPNLVQTTENTAAFIYGGPFANIAHGCNSTLATKMAMTFADYVVTEAGFAINNAFAQGGKGAVELARLVTETIANNPSEKLKFTYEDSDPIRTKVEKIALNIYGADTVVFNERAEKILKLAQNMNIEHFPVCIAKTQYSFSADPKAYGVAKRFKLKINDIVINNGAEFIVAIAGEIMRMPGLPKNPQAMNIDIVNGFIEGLS